MQAEETAVCDHLFGFGDGRQREYAVAAGGDGLAEQVSDDRVALAELFGGKGRPTEVIGAIAIDGSL